MAEEKNANADLLNDLGLGNLSEDKREELIAKMTEVVLKRIFIETVEKLNEKDQEEYAKMIENKVTPEEMEKFLLEKIPDYDAMVKKIVDDFKEEVRK
jgi:hypothetical protein